MRTGHADLPLHGGHAPRWLFERMTGLAREVSLAVVVEEGPGRTEKVRALKRLAGSSPAR